MGAQEIQTEGGIFHEMLMGPALRQAVGQTRRSFLMKVRDNKLNLITRYM
jgi:hypothetical protein